MGLVGLQTTHPVFFFCFFFGLFFFVFFILEDFLKKFVVNQ